MKHRERRDHPIFAWIVRLVTASLVDSPQLVWTTRPVPSSDVEGLYGGDRAPTS